MWTTIPAFRPSGAKQSVNWHPRFMPVKARTPRKVADIASTGMKSCGALAKLND